MSTVGVEPLEREGFLTTWNPSARQTSQTMSTMALDWLDTVRAAMQDPGVAGVSLLIFRISVV